jgi:Fe-S-cluster containining protein
MAKFWKQGIRFECQGSGNCCTFEGGAIYASGEEFQEIANFLNVSEKEFFAKYTTSIGGHVSIKSTDENPCIFYEKGCKIYSVRPTQCKTYPFWEEIVNNERMWQKESKKCPGIGKGKLWPKEKIRQELQKNIQFLKKN